MAAAGLGLRLHDLLYGTDTHWVFDRWWEHARRRYMALPEGGPPEWAALYYDPIIDHVQKGGPRIGVALALYLAPQVPETARLLYDWSVAALGWDDSDRPVFAPPTDARLLALGLALATEFGDRPVRARLRAHAEEHLEPTWDRTRGEFWYGFGLGEPHPRGQPNGTIMIAETGGEGAWRRIFNAPNLRKFVEPAVTGVDYPTLGIAQASYDPAHDLFAVTTYAADPTAAGRRTSFRVERLRGTADIRIERDGRPYEAWRATGPETIEVTAEAGDHAYLILGVRA